MEFSGLSIETVSFLFFAAMAAGFLDTLAGGGGLITLPALIVSGIPPLAALGTNKLQGSTGTATATYLMLKFKKISWGKVKRLMLSAFMGSLCGTIGVQFINTNLLSFVIPIVLICIALYFLISHRLFKGNKRIRLSNSNYSKFIIPLIGGYDGMFGPGTGSFFIFSGVALRGQELIDATAIAKALNFSTNIASLIIFLMAGKFVWLAGLVMMVGQFIGAWGGSFCLFKINPQHLRIIIVLMCLGMLVKYSFSMGWLA